MAHHEIDYEAFLPRLVASLAINVGPDGTGAEATVCDAGTGRPVARVPYPGWAESGDPVAFKVLTFSPDGRSLCAADRAKRVHRYDLAAGRALPPLAGHLGEVEVLCFHPDGRRLYSAGADRVVRRWDLTTGKEIPLPPGYVGDRVFAAAPGGAAVAVGDQVGRVDDSIPNSAQFSATLLYKRAPSRYWRGWPDGLVSFHPGRGTRLRRNPPPVK